MGIETIPHRQLFVITAPLREGELRDAVRMSFHSPSSGQSTVGIACRKATADEITQFTTYKQEAVSYTLSDGTFAFPPVVGSFIHLRPICVQHVVRNGVPKTFQFHGDMTLGGGERYEVTGYLNPTSPARDLVGLLIVWSVPPPPELYWSVFNP